MSLQSGTPADESAPAAPAARPHLLDEDQYQFPVLASALATYYATGKVTQFLDRYEKYGETSVEFAGLADDLKAAIRSPQKATAEVNAILGLNHDVPLMRGQLIELHDQITHTGAFSDEAIAAAKAAEKAAQPTTEEIFSSYSMRKVRLPFAVEGKGHTEVPLWMVLVAGVGVTLVGYLLSFVPLPFVGWFSVLLIVLGLLVAGGTAAWMLTIRREVAPRSRLRRDRAQAAGDGKGAVEKVK